MGAMFDGDILAANGQIIVVTFNYRVSVLGTYVHAVILSYDKVARRYGQFVKASITKDLSEINYRTFTFNQNLNKCKMKLIDLGNQNPITFSNRRTNKTMSKGGK